VSTWDYKSPDYALPGHKDSDKFVSVEEWLNECSFNVDRGDEALAKCPNTVRHAIAMFGIWRGLIIQSNPAVRALAHAVAASQAPHVALSSQTSFTLGRRILRLDSKGYPVLPSRMMHHFGVNMHKLSVVSTGASTMDKKRLGYSPYSRGRSYDADDHPGMVAEIYEDNYQILRDKGELVRPKANETWAFFRALRPVMCPYWLGEPQPYIKIVKPRSTQDKAFIPLSLQVGMSWAAAVLPHAIRESLNHSYEWIRLRCEQYAEQREEFAMQAMARSKMTADLMEKFDQTAVCMYLQPTIEPQVTRHIVDNVNFMDFSIPGLNGAEHLQEQAK